MIDVVDLAAAVLQLDQYLQDRQHVVLAQGSHLIVGLEAEARVHLHAADGREVVAFGIEEQAVEHRLRGLQRRRLALPDTREMVNNASSRGGFLFPARGFLKEAPPLMLSMARSEASFAAAQDRVFIRVSDSHAAAPA